MAGNPIVVRNDASIQAQFKSANAVYIIRDVIDLKNTKLSIPQNCILKFEGGQLKNGSIVYNNTFLDGRYQIYCQCSGTLSNDIVEPHMYGARGDGKTDDSDAIQKTINSGKSVTFRRATYILEKPVVFDRQNYIVDFNFATLKKLNKTGIDYKYENYDFKNIPCVILIKPYASNTSGHIVIRNLIIEGGEVNVVVAYALHLRKLYQFTFPPDIFSICRGIPLSPTGKRGYCSGATRPFWQCSIS